MGDLRIKARELLQLNQDKQELSKETHMKEERVKSIEKFTEKMEEEIAKFQSNLLQSANMGETLKIDIMKLDGENLVSWWDERENNIEKNRDYSPIKSEIVTFIDDINLRFLNDEIILDKTLQKLYDTIQNSDIYPEWGVKINGNGEIVSLYLEANPLISYNEKKEALEREKRFKSGNLLMVDSNIGIKKTKFILKNILNSIFLFLAVLYFSIAILTLLSSVVGITAPPESNFLEVGWPYFLASNFSKVWGSFLFSLPLGILIALYSTYPSRKVL